MEIEKDSKVSTDRGNTEEEKDNKLYKFHTNLANIFKFYDWANQIDIKKHIQDYLLKNRLYNKKSEEIEVYK